jgi:hypothetical protein
MCGSVARRGTVARSTEAGEADTLGRGGARGQEREEYRGRRNVAEGKGGNGVKSMSRSKRRRGRAGG